MERKPSDIVTIGIRMRESLRQQIEIAAKANAHSLNREMNRRLGQTFQDADMDAIVQRAAESAAAKCAGLLADQMADIIEATKAIRQAVEPPGMPKKQN
jgi:hypothetical protein